VIILGYDLWRSSFTSDPAIVGKSVVVDGAPWTFRSGSGLEGHGVKILGLRRRTIG